MRREPVGALSAALADPARWVRIGAERAAPWLAPDNAAELLERRVGELSDPLPVDEAATLAVALAQAGGEALPLLARLLDVDADSLRAALDGGYDKWADFVNELVSRRDLRGPFRILAPMYVAWNGGGRSAWRQLAHPAETPVNIERARAGAARTRLKLWRNFATGWRDDTEMSALAEGTFGAAIEALEAGDADGAIDPLLSTAITASDPWMRIVARQTLPALGVQAAMPLLSVLAGRSELRPGADVFASIEEESLGSIPADMTQGQFGAFLAGEVLEEFRDVETAFAAVRAALSWQGEPQARAKRVVARMSADVALPALTWSALYGAAQRERTAANDLLRRIVVRDPALGIRFHRIETTEIPDGNLDWLLPIASARAPDRPWMEDVGVAIPVLREAIAALPAIVGSTGYVYSTPATGDRAEEFSRSISEILRRDPAIDIQEARPRIEVAGRSLPESGGIRERLSGVLERLRGLAQRSPSPEARGTTARRTEETIFRDDGSPASSQPAEAPSGTVCETRHPQAGFPAQCGLGKEETLSVRLLTDAAQGTAEPFAVPFVGQQQEVDLLVLVMAAGFEVTPGYAVLRVPRGVPSEAVEFRLKARSTGRQAIDIKFMLGTTAIGHCGIVTEVMEAKPARRDGTQQGEEASPAAEAFMLDPIRTDAADLKASAHAVLRVKKLPDGYLDWTLLTRDSAEPRPLGLSPSRFTSQEAAALADQQGMLIRQTLEKDLSREDIGSVLAQLRALGRKLFAQVAPPEVAGVLDALPENALVVIDSDADWIPWELLACRPGTDLWGEAFVIVRAPAATKPPGAVVAPPPPEPPANTVEHAAMVIGDKISEPGRLGRRTFGGLLDRVDPVLIERSWAEVCAGVADKDLVHFACHGRSEPSYHLSYKDGIGGYFYPDQAHDLGLKWGAVVFANACSSATNELLLAEFQSFGREFYFAGARPFIGTLGPVPEAEAVEFAAIFYQQFIIAGLPAGQAMRRTKQIAAGRFKKPIWLYYCLYGQPSTARQLGTG